MSDLVVVPTPLRKSRAERRLCDAQGGTLLGMRVATIPQLVPGLLAAAGDSRALLGPLAERLLALDAAAEAGLAGPASSPATAATSGAARAAARLLSELRQGEVTPADLRAAAVGAPERVGERLHAAARALESYESRLAARAALDAAGALRAAADAAARGAAPDEARDVGLLVLEGLLPTSRAALDLGSALASRARRVLARVPFLPAEAEASAPAAPWLRRIEALHAAEARGQVELRFVGEGPLPRGRAVRLPASTEEDQLEGAARLAGSLLDDGMAPGDVAVIAPRRLLAGLRAPFDRAAVPLAVPATVPVASLAPVRDLRSAIGAAAAGIDRTSLVALLGSPYLAVAEPIPDLRLLLDRAGVLDGRGDPAARLEARAALLAGGSSASWERPGLRRALAATRDLRRLLGTLDGSDTPRGWSARLRAFVDRSGVRRRAAEGPAPVARRDVAALSRVEDTADDLARALGALGRGAERLDLPGWAALLDVALSRVEFPEGQGPAAGAVEAWPIEEAPGLEARAVMVLGADPGSWPSPPRVDPVLGNAARERLDDHLGRRALPTAWHDRADAEHRGLCALAAGSELLAVGYTVAAGEGAPAPLAARVLDLGAAPVQPFARDPSLGQSRSASDALRAAARLRTLPALAALPADLALRAADAAARGACDEDRRNGGLAGRAGPWGGLVPADLPAWREALPGEWSATHLETFAACPFRFLLRTAGVREPGAGGLDMEPRDEGALLHAILERLVRSLRDRGAWPPAEDAATAEEARRIAESEFARFEAGGRLGDPATWAARRESLRVRIDRFLASEAGGDPALRPLLLEQAFGGASGVPPLQIPDEAGEVLVQGRIDRVDGDGRRLLVLDYKNARSADRSREKLSAEALGTTSFQAPLYVLAAARELPGREELQAAFALLPAGERVGPWSIRAGDPLLAIDPVRRAEVRAAGGRTLADGVVAIVSRIRAGEAPPASEDCTGCPYGAPCRFARPGEA